MLLPLVYYGNTILRTKTQQVERFDAELRAFVTDMVEVMHHYKGMGLAAPQVGKSIAVFITAVPEYDAENKPLPIKERVYINPSILEVSKECWIRQEGCLSIPKLYEEVERPFTIKVEFNDLAGERITTTLTGWEARTFLHENDHINGVLYIDRIDRKRRQRIEPLLRAIKKKYNG